MTEHQSGATAYMQTIFSRVASALDPFDGTLMTSLKNEANKRATVSTLPSKVTSDDFLSRALVLDLALNVITNELDHEEDVARIDELQLLIATAAKEKDRALGKLKDISRSKYAEMKTEILSLVIADLLPSGQSEQENFSRSQEYIHSATPLPVDLDRRSVDSRRSAKPQDHFGQDSPANSHNPGRDTRTMDVQTNVPGRRMSDYLLDEEVVRFAPEEKRGSFSIQRRDSNSSLPSHPLPQEQQQQQQQLKANFRSDQHQREEMDARRPYIPMGLVSESEASRPARRNSFSSVGHEETLAPQQRRGSFSSLPKETALAPPHHRERRNSTSSIVSASSQTGSVSRLVVRNNVDESDSSSLKRREADLLLHGNHTNNNNNHGQVGRMPLDHLPSSELNRVRRETPSSTRKKRAPQPPPPPPPPPSFNNNDAVLFDRERQALLKELERTRSEYRQMRENEERMAVELATLVEELQSRVVEVQRRAQESLSVKEEEIELLRRTCREKEEEIAALKHRCEEIEQLTSQDFAEEMLRLAKEFDKEREEWQKMKQETELAVQEMRHSLETRFEREKELAVMSATELAAEMASDEARIQLEEFESRMEKELKDMKRNLFDGFQLEMSSLKDTHARELSKLMEENSRKEGDFTSRINSFQEQTKQKESEWTKMMEAMNQEKSILQNKLVSLEEKIASEESKWKQLSLENESLRVHLSKTSQDASDVLNRVSGMEQEKVLLMNQIQALNEQMEKERQEWSVRLEQEKEEIRKQMKESFDQETDAVLETMDAEKSELTDRLNAEWSHKVSELNAKFNEMQHGLEAERQTLQTRLDSLKQEMDREMHSQQEQLTGKWSTQVEQLTRERDQLILRLEQIDQERNQSLQNMTQFDQERTSLLERIHGLESQQQELATKLAQSEQALGAISNQFQVEKQEWNARIQQAQVERIGLMTSLSSLEAEKTELQSTLSLAMSEKSSLSQRVAELEQQVSSEQAKVFEAVQTRDALVKRCEEIEYELGEERQRCATLEFSLEDMQNTIAENRVRDDGQVRIQQLESDLASLQTSLEEQRVKTQQAESGLEAARQEMDALQKERAELSGMISNLLAEHQKIQAEWEQSDQEKQELISRHAQEVEKLVQSHVQQQESMRKQLLSEHEREKELLIRDTTNEMYRFEQGLRHSMDAQMDKQQQMLKMSMTNLKGEIRESLAQNTDESSSRVVATAADVDMKAREEEIRKELETEFAARLEQSVKNAVENAETMAAEVFEMEKEELKEKYESELSLLRNNNVEYALQQKDDEILSLRQQIEAMQSKQQMQDEVVLLQNQHPSHANFEIAKLTTELRIAREHARTAQEKLDMETRKLRAELESKAKEWRKREEELSLLLSSQNEQVADDSQANEEQQVIIKEAMAAQRAQLEAELAKALAETNERWQEFCEQECERRVAVAREMAEDDFRLQKEELEAEFETKLQRATTIAQSSTTETAENDVPNRSNKMHHPLMRSRSDPGALLAAEASTISAEELEAMRSASASLKRTMESILVLLKETSKVSRESGRTIDDIDPQSKLKDILRGLMQERAVFAKGMLHLQQQVLKHSSSTSSSSATSSMGAGEMTRTRGEESVHTPLSERKQHLGNTSSAASMLVAVPTSTTNNNNNNKPNISEAEELEKLAMEEVELL